MDSDSAEEEAPESEQKAHFNSHINRLWVALESLAQLGSGQMENRVPGFLHFKNMLPKAMEIKKFD